MTLVCGACFRALHEAWRVGHGAAHINSFLASRPWTKLFFSFIVVVLSTHKIRFDSDADADSDARWLSCFYYGSHWLRVTLRATLKGCQSNLLLLLLTVGQKRQELAALLFLSIFTCVSLRQSLLYLKFVYNDFTFASCLEKSQQFFNLLSGNDDEGSDASSDVGSDSGSGNKNCQLPQKRLQSRRGVIGGGVSRGRGRGQTSGHGLTVWWIT